jgi:hypothetical protein
MLDRYHLITQLFFIIFLLIYKNKKMIVTTFKKYLNEKLKDDSDILYHATNST